MLLSPVRKILNSSSRLVCCAIKSNNGFLHSNNTNFMISKQHFFSGFLSKFDTTTMYNALEKVKLMNPLNKSKFEANSWVLYEKMVDQILFDEIMKKLDLPDTFNSWFVITELHLWMIFVRLMNEGSKGSMIRNFIMEALWNDVEFRSKKLGANPDIRNRQVKELSDQIRGALIGYDEGWLTNDKVLASMVWRRIFNQECDDPQKIELVVKYIRKQMSLLQHQAFDSLFKDKEVKWIKFE